MIMMIKENTQKVVDKVEETTQPVVSPVYKAARSLLLASIGALALTKEEVEALVDRLVEKGEITEKEGRKLVEEITARTKETHKEVTQKVSQKVSEPISKKDEMMEKMEEAFTQRVQAILNSMNIPSKNDIEELTKKIDKLARKVSELDKKLSAESKVVDVEPAKAKKAA